MDIQHEQGTDQGKFYIMNEGDRIAAIVYTKSGDNLVIEHTEVTKSQRGKNIGYQLVHRIVEYARSAGLKVFPVCAFAKAVFNRRSEWADVMA